MTVLNESGWIASVVASSFNGSSLSSFFFSAPISDVQSIFPDPCPSPSFFSHMVNVKPQLLIVWTSLWRWTPFASPFFFKKSLLSSHSIASSMRLARRTSVILKRRWSSSKTIWSKGILISGVSTKPNLRDCASDSISSKVNAIGALVYSVSGLDMSHLKWNSGNYNHCYLFLNNCANKMNFTCLSCAPYTTSTRGLMLHPIVHRQGVKTIERVFG